MAVTWDQLELPFSTAADGAGGAECPSRSPFATFEECPLCSGRLDAEHAHFRCLRCGWRDSCCD